MHEIKTHANFCKRHVFVLQIENRFKDMNEIKLNR